jgi:hypothetical protein
MNSKIDTPYVFVKDKNRICQGDIFKDVEIPVVNAKASNKGEVESVDFDFLVVLSQDCDLDTDINNHASLKENKFDDFKKAHPIAGENDKFLHSILLCPAYLIEEFKNGDHLKKNLGYKMDKITSKRWDQIKINQNPRFHHLDKFTDLQVPELVIDFKHYYTMSRDSAYNILLGQYVATTNELFREFLSQRFSFYLSRVGLPPINIK